MTAVHNLLKYTVRKQLQGAVHTILGIGESQSNKVLWSLRFIGVKKHSKFGRNSPQLRLSLHHLRSCGLLPQDVSFSKQKQIFRDLAASCSVLGKGEGVNVTEEYIDFKVPHASLTQAVLCDILSNANYGSLSPWHQLVPKSDNTNVTEAVYGQTVVVEFSSPNIAKPFHAGHLRSTVIGNTIANVNSFLGNNTIKINYLGDWGTQFGLLFVGFQRVGSWEQLEKEPMKHLFDVYVAANRMQSEDASGAFHQEAMQAFQQMESGEQNVLEFWSKCRSHSISEYAKIYKRLGVTFDDYQGESMFFKQSMEVVRNIREKRLLETHKDSGVSFIDLTEQSDKNRVYANLLKADGSTLYITRDIAAAMDRYQQYGLDRMHYVVENGQHLHFLQLFRALHRLEHPWCPSSLSELHVKFGRVQGMSTRKGKVVFLSDILEEACQRMCAVMKDTPTTRVSGDDLEAVAEKLGVSAVIIEDLKHRRLTDYTFSWENTLRFRGDTGVFLQYTHTRLTSLIEKSGISLEEVGERLFTDASLVSQLAEPSAVRLIQHLARYAEAIHMTYIELEPCHLVQYLFTLGRLVSVAFDELHVRGQEADVALVRVALFHSAHLVLASGLRIVGIEPLDQM